MKKLFFLILLIIFNNSYSQTLNFLPKGLGLEVGFGYNQLKHQALPIETFYSTESYLCNHFKLTPTVRLSFEKEIITNFSLMPFMSYSITGGKSNKEPNRYEDEILFKTLDLGLFTSYNFHIVTFSIGGKYNRFLDVTSRAYGSSVDPITVTREWTEQDMSVLFRDWSFDLGGRTSYTLNNFTFAIEGWFSITELSSKIVEDVVSVNSKRFQLLLGYRL